jgi:histidinol-phosphatase (PHP family)
MEDMVKQAISQGLNEICFTEHFDYGLPRPEAVCNSTIYYPKVLEMQQKYGQAITIKCGAEFGMQIETIPNYITEFAAHPFDFIILSCHQIDGKEFWLQDFQRGKTQDEINHQYYEAIYNVMTHYHNYSVLGHLDAIKRDDPYGCYDDDKVMDAIEKVLKQVIADGKGIEINTSSFKYNLPDLTPSRKIIQKYYDLGGELLTIGSDAHETTRLEDHFQEVKTTLRQIGFHYFYTFDHMVPVRQTL